MCNLLLQDACTIGDNSTLIDKTGFQQNDVMFGPPLPPPSWPTKVSIDITNALLEKLLLNVCLVV